MGLIFIQNRAMDYMVILYKLQRLSTNFGIKGKALDWFTSYLTDRSQFVQIDVSESDKLSLLCGVPQGSVLAPFCISYIPHLLAIHCDVTTCHFTFMLMTPNYIQPSLTTMN